MRSDLFLSGGSPQSLGVDLPYRLAGTYSISHPDACDKSASPPLPSRGRRSELRVLRSRQGGPGRRALTVQLLTDFYLTAIRVFKQHDEPTRQLCRFISSDLSGDGPPNHQGIGVGVSASGHFSKQD